MAAMVSTRGAQAGLPTARSSSAVPESKKTVTTRTHSATTRVPGSRPRTLAPSKKSVEERVRRRLSLHTAGDGHRGAGSMVLTSGVGREARGMAARPSARRSVAADMIAQHERNNFNAHREVSRRPARTSRRYSAPPGSYTNATVVSAAKKRPIAATPRSAPASRASSRAAARRAHITTRSASIPSPSPSSSSAEDSEGEEDRKHEGVEEEEERDEEGVVFDEGADGTPASPSPTAPPHRAEETPPSASGTTGAADPGDDGRVDELRADLELQMRNGRRLERENRRLETEIEAQRDESAHELQTLRHQVKVMETKCAQLDRQCCKAQHRTASLQQASKNKELALAEMDERVRLLTSQNDGLSADATKLKRQLRDNKDRLSATTALLQEQDGQGDELARLSSTARQSAQDLARMQEEVRAAESRAETADSLLAAEQDTSAALKASECELKEAARSLREQLNQAKEAATAAAAQHGASQTSQVRELQASLRDAEARTAELQAADRNQAEEIEWLTTQLEASERTVRGLEEAQRTAAAAEPPCLASDLQAAASAKAVAEEEAETWRVRAGVAERTLGRILADEEATMQDVVELELDTVSLRHNIERMHKAYARLSAQMEILLDAD